MNTINSSVSDSGSAHLAFSDPPASVPNPRRVAHHFINDPKAKFILTCFGDVLNANIEASKLLRDGVLSRLPEGKLSYGSTKINNSVMEILEQFRLSRTSCMKLLKRYEDEWIALEFSSTDFNVNKEILLTIYPRNFCREDSIVALSKAFGFTVTEAEVVRHISMAYCPKEISAKMDISTNTVRAHLRSIYSKTGMRGYNRTLRLILQLIT